MAEPKPKMDIFQIICLGVGIAIGMILIQAVFGIRGILGGALGGGLGALIGIAIYTLLGRRSK